MIRVGIIGADGRVGRNLIEQILQDNELSLTAAVTRQESPHLGKDVGILIGREAFGVALTSDLGGVLSSVDVMIDFTSPQAVISNLKVLAAAQTPVVIGTTGFSAEEMVHIQTAAHLTAILLSPNMSLGINLVYNFLAQAAKILGSQSDIEILEMHHRYKKDAPSGTAIEMGKVIAAALGKSFEACAVYDRHSAGMRQAGEIGFASLRGGSVVGDHTVIFADLGEQIEITHKAKDRSIFAKGALHCAKWLYAQKAGLYAMNDTL